MALDMWYSIHINMHVLFFCNNAVLQQLRLNLAQSFRLDQLSKSRMGLNNVYEFTWWVRQRNRDVG